MIKGNQRPKTAAEGRISCPLEKCTEQCQKNRGIDDFLKIVPGKVFRGSFVKGKAAVVEEISSKVILQLSQKAVQ